MRSVMMALILLGAAVAIAQDVNIDRSGESPIEAKFAPSGKVRMDLCPGGVKLVGVDEPAVRVSFEPERESVHVRLDIRGDRADLRMTGCPHNNFRVRIEVPKSSSLYVRMFAGQLDVNDITGDKDLEVTFGQLNIDAGKAETYASVDASVNSGQIDANEFNVHKGGLFRSFDQRGSGKYKLHAHVAAGQIEIR